MDPLSDVFRVVRLTGAYFYLVEASAPWSVGSRPARELAPRILPESEHLISYHIVTRGTCWGGVTGERPQRLEAGDVIVFPHGDPHVMSSHEQPRMPLDDDSAAPPRYPDTVTIGDGTDRDTHFVCGFPPVTPPQQAPRVTMWYEMRCSDSGRIRGASSRAGREPTDQGAEASTR